MKIQADEILARHSLRQVGGEQSLDGSFEYFSRICDPAHSVLNNPAILFPATVMLGTDSRVA
jgi:hypothetical protein